MSSMTCTERKRARSPHQPVGRWCRPDLRLAIYLRDEFACLACGRDLRDADPKDITLDHIKPRSQGGSNRPSNLVTACRTCNARRQDTPLSRFVGPETRAVIRRHIARKIDRYRTMARSLLTTQN